MITYSLNINLPSQLAKHLKDVHFGGNWTTVNLKDTLADVNLKGIIEHTHYHLGQMTLIKKLLLNADKG